MQSPAITHPDHSAHKNLRWLYVLRNLTIGGETLVILISVYVLNIPLPRDPLAGVLACLVFLNYLTWWRLSSTDFPVTNVELFVQLAFDVIGITAILYFTGGATNPIAWFFLLPLIIAATVLPQAYSWYMVIFTSACYTLLIGYYVPLPELAPPLPDPEMTAHMHELIEHHHIELHVFGMWFGFIFSAVLVAYFVVEMASTIRERDYKLAEAREQALRNERVVALGTLATGAAHEMGTPLGTMAIVLGELEQEIQHDSQDPELRDKVRILKEQVWRCKDALSVISASAGEVRADSGFMTPVDRFLEDVIRLWQSQRLRTHLEISLSGCDPTPRILAERTLTHALVNILNNAADVSPEFVSLKARWTDNQVRIEIIDKGPGISPSVTENLGKVPMSTKPHGLGVGLFLAHATLERLNGTLEMEPAPTGGTCTRIILPLVSKVTDGA